VPPSAAPAAGRTAILRSSPTPLYASVRCFNGANQYAVASSAPAVVDDSEPLAAGLDPASLPPPTSAEADYRCAAVGRYLLALHQERRAEHVSIAGTTSFGNATRAARAFARTLYLERHAPSTGPFLEPCAVPGTLREPCCVWLSSLLLIRWFWVRFALEQSQSATPRRRREYEHAPRARQCANCPVPALPPRAPHMPLKSNASCSCRWRQIWTKPSVARQPGYTACSLSGEGNRSNSS